MSVTDYKVISIIRDITPINAQLSDLIESINIELKKGYTLNGPTRISVLCGSGPIFTQNLVKYSTPQSAKIKEYAIIYTEVSPYFTSQRFSEIKTFEEKVMKFIKEGFVLYDNLQETLTNIGMSCHYYWQVLVKYETS